MRKAQQHQAGFGLAAVLIVVVLVGVVGYIGWSVWNASQKKPATANTSNSSTNNGGNGNNTSADQYAGWKSYCDSVEKVCFKYPADWALDADSSGATLQNPSKSVIVRYANGDTRDGADMPYYTAVVEDLATISASFKVLGGYVVPSSGDIRPELKVVDAKFTSGLTAGQQGSTTNTARFTNKDGTTGHLEAYPSNTTGYDTAKAKAWFGTADGKTAELLVKSFYVQ